MEERVPLTSRPTRNHSVEQRNGTVMDDGSMELLEHLIAIVLQGNTQYLETLLVNEEILEVLDMHDNKGFTALHIASERVDSESVRLLLEADANPNVVDRFSRTALHWVVSGGCHCDHCDSMRARCTELLLKAKGHLELKDVKGETPLSYAVKNGFYKVATVMIEHGAEINRACNGVTSAQLLIQKMPEVMTHLLDQSVTYDYEDNSKLKVDFKVLIPPQPSKNKDKVDEKHSSGTENSDAPPPRRRPVPQKELTLIESFVNASPPIRDALLTHPVTATFLHLKWNYVWKWFWFIRILYTIMTAAYTYFIFKLYVTQCPQREETQSTNGNEGQESCSSGLELFILGICIAAWAGLMILSAFYGLVHSLKVTCTSGFNLGWWMLIGSVTLSVLPVFEILPIQWKWQYIAAMFSVLFSWIMNLRHWSQVPGIGDYIIMFFTVLRRVVIAQIMFAGIFFGSVLGFCILTRPESTSSKNLSTSALSYFLMILGYHAHENIVTNPIEIFPKDWEAIGTDIYAIGFIVVFGIVMMNLFIALAVTGVQAVEKNGNFAKITRKIKAISALESMLNDNWILNCIQKGILGQISVYCRNGRYFRLDPMDQNDKKVPPEIKAKFIPMIQTRDCLNKREEIPNPIRAVGQVGQGQGFSRSAPFRGSGHSARHTADIDEILFELKQKLEGLQNRRRLIQRGNPIFC